MKEFSIIAAVSLNGIIGNSQTNSLPWNLPQDLAYFKNKTLNKTIVMGSNTYKSLKKPLKDRRNVVITSNEEYKKVLHNEGVDQVYSSFSEMYENEKDGFFIIGGQSLFAEGIKSAATKMFITIVNLSNVKGDVFFPMSGKTFTADGVITPSGWSYHCTKRTNVLVENNTEFQFTEFERSV